MATKPTPKPTDLELAFRAFQNRIEALTLPTSAAGPVANAAELQDFADHLAEAGDAFRSYATAVHSALADITPVHIPSSIDTMEDTINDLVGAIRRAARRVEQEAA